MKVKKAPSEWRGSCSGHTPKVRGSSPWSAGGLEQTIRKKDKGDAPPAQHIYVVECQGSFEDARAR